MFLLGCQLKKALLRGQSLNLFLFNVSTNDLFCFMDGVSINTESIRKLSTINFQWTKTLYQNIKEYCDKSRLNKYINSTWSHENRVSKHFVIFLNFPCLIACLLCCLLVSFLFLLVLWLGVCVEVDVDRITILPPSLPSFYFFFVPTHNSLFNNSYLTVVWQWQLFEISERLKLVSVPFSSLLLDIGYLEKCFKESTM